jgi:rhomboid protease GluP
MQTKHFPIVTISIILLNGIIFAAGLLSGEQTHIIQKYGFIPDQFFNAHNVENNNDQQNSLTSLLRPSEPQLMLSPLPNSLTRLVASMFVHANIAHIAFNLLALAYLGVYAERAIGVPRYLLVYLSSGIKQLYFMGLSLFIYYIMEM